MSRDRENEGVQKERDRERERILNITCSCSTFSKKFGMITVYCISLIFVDSGTRVFKWENPGRCLVGTILPAASGGSFYHA